MDITKTDLSNIIMMSHVRDRDEYDTFEEASELADKTKLPVTFYKYSNSRWVIVLPDFENTGQRKENE